SGGYQNWKVANEDLKLNVRDNRERFSLSEQLEYVDAAVKPDGTRRLLTFSRELSPGALRVSKQQAENEPYLFRRSVAVIVAPDNQRGDRGAGGLILDIRSPALNVLFNSRIVLRPKKAS